MIHVTASSVLTPIPPLKPLQSCSRYRATRGCDRVGRHPDVALAIRTMRSGRTHVSVFAAALQPIAASLRSAAATGPRGYGIPGVIRGFWCGGDYALTAQSVTDSGKN
ncbi:hypothetical protein C4K16_2828 [Pseudomonas chlororaphis subsp. aurantiaca]|nr:hypothetical protein C4K16_2828 [Pseudomonas chlororaphis subsp. aurantiaca]